MHYIHWEKADSTIVTSLWNKNIGKTFPMRNHLMRQNSFNHSQVIKNASWLALNENNELIGFIVGKSSGRDGWIQMIMVDEEYRHKGIGKELLKLSEEGLKENGVNNIALGKDRYHYFPGVPANLQDLQSLVKKSGYESDGFEYDMLGDFSAGVSIPTLPAGVTCGLLPFKQKNALLEFLQINFPGRWVEEAEDYFIEGGQGREFLIMKDGGKIIGFARINDEKSPVIFQNTYWTPLFDKKVGGIGPLGIVAEERGNGYGEKLVQAAMAFLSERGIQKIIIDWTTLVSFYKRLGFVPWRKYNTYSKNVE